MELDKVTGLPISVPIEFYLNGKFLGKTLVTEMSMSSSRIAAARSIGINYYDRFILRPGDQFESDSLKVIINDQAFNDFESQDKRKYFKQLFKPLEIIKPRRRFRR